MKEKADKATFKVSDVGQIAVGACVMAFPVIISEELWDLGAELSMGRALYFALASWFFLGAFIRLMHHDPEVEHSRQEFFKRVISTYMITLVICALLLLGIDRLELLDNPLVGLKRTILAAFPASFAATVVDGMS